MWGNFPRYTDMCEAWYRVAVQYPFLCVWRNIYVSYYFLFPFIGRNPLLFKFNFRYSQYLEFCIRLILTSPIRSSYLRLFVCKKYCFLTIYKNLTKRNWKIFSPLSFNSSPIPLLWTMSSLLSRVEYMENLQSFSY